MMDEKTPLIRLTFFLKKKDRYDFDRNLVTQILSITPTESAGPRIWRRRVICDPISEDKTFEEEGATIFYAPTPPYEAISHACWILKTPKIETRCLREPLQQFEQKLRGKEEKILEICKDHNLMARLLVTVYAESNSMPDLSIASSSLSFWGSIGAPIGFDFQLD